MAPTPDTVSLTTLRVWQELGPWMQRDGEQGYPLLTLVDAWGSLHDVTEQFTRDTDTHEGWGVILDANACPSFALPYLAQFAGAVVPAGTDDATTRALIMAARSSKRGSPDSLVAIAQAYLTGSKRVDVIERDGGHAYRFRIRTYEHETPTGVQPLITAALALAKPALHLMTYEVSEGPTIAQLVGLISAQNPSPSGTIADYATIVPQ